MMLNIFYGVLGIFGCCATINIIGCLYDKMNAAKVGSSED